ncbi:hypothetical protein LAWI1_G004476 [Lachnellula willkommii]|uniref:Uncharacterized protein n=1 Tax=Lachnellula willkommii TaxID=215461 RepID=A0A559MF01_9HELO|nr:hypothetical protein LAWI1_G004476 [Lachnellula willkommii]
MAVTQMGLKYGVYEDGHNCSGLTPLYSLFPTSVDRLSLRERLVEQQNKYFEGFQKIQLYGFTTRELVNLDAVSSRYLKSPDLSNDIHILMAQRRWETKIDVSSGRTGFYPIGNGYPGDWVASNPIVWTAMLPCLRLASRMIMNFHMLTLQFDALLKGDTHPVAGNRLPPSPLQNMSSAPVFIPPKTTLHTRNGQSYTFAETEKERDEIFKYMISAKMCLRWGFRIPTEDPLNGQADPVRDRVHGQTYWDSAGPRPALKIYINVTNVEPLLNQNLTDSERLNGQFFIAVTILHEIMASGRHATWMARCDQDFNLHTNVTGNPYFEDETLAEVGFSMENNVFGGIPEAMGDNSYRQDHNSSHLGIWSTAPFMGLSFVHMSDKVLPVLTHPPLSKYKTVFPYKVTFIEDMHQEEFWEGAVRKYGLQVFRSRVSLVGARITYLDADHCKNSRKYRIGNHPEVFINNINTEKPTPAELQSMTPQERASSKYVQKLVQSAKFEEAFFDISAYIHKEVDDVLRVISGSGSTAAKWQQQHYMKLAVEYHLAAAQALPASEETDGTIYTDRRENLLRWNKGVRVFIRKLTGSSDGEEFRTLEYVRMLLSDPETTPSEAVEMSSLQQATDLYTSGQLAACLQACTDLAADTECSLFVEAAARVLAAMLQAVRPNVEDRAVDLHYGYNRLAMILGKPGVPGECPEAWKPSVNTFLTACADLYPQLQAEYMQVQAAA